MGKVILFGFHFFLIGLLLVFLSFFFYLINMGPFWQVFLFSSTLIIIGILSAVYEIFLLPVFFPEKKVFRQDIITNPKIAIGMTAYNDEQSIGNAVKDFSKQQYVSQIIVIDNNCVDNTALEAKKAGAIVVKEPIQGYGAACIRALKEARKQGNLIVLVEGDGTFSGTDLKKLYSYLENVDMVLGTRTTMEIVSADSQINWFIQYGNIFIGKLIQLRYWGKLRLTDVGCTFRIIRPEALDKILPQLKVTGNHFSPHMILVALKNNLKLIEVPVTLKKRVGESKGVGADIIKGLKTGFRMWFEILVS